MNVLFYRFHFSKKHVALLMFFWVNILLSYWKPFWINDLKCLFQLFVFNELHVFLSKIIILFSRFIWYFHMLSIISPFWFWNLIQLNLIVILICIHWKIIFNKEIYARNKHTHRLDFRYPISKIFIRFF